MTIAASGVVFQMFNAAFLSGPVETEQEMDRCIRNAEMHFDTRGLEWAFWLCEDWLDARSRRRARYIFSHRGLRLSVELPGMFCESLLPPERGLPKLEIRRVHNGPTREDFCALGSTCFNVPLPWFCEVFEDPHVWQDFVGYVGYHEGEPVCTAATVTGSGVVGLYNVGTLPSYRRKGFGEVMVRHALERAWAEHGRLPSILQSTPAGLRMYERMGYRAVTRITVFAS